MRFLRELLDRHAHHFERGGRLEKLFPLYEATDTFLYTPATVTRAGAHVRDALDLKRMMILVVVALIPCTLMAMYNTGLQALTALDGAKVAALEGWRYDRRAWGPALPSAQCISFRSTSSRWPPADSGRWCSPRCASTRSTRASS
jgi:Na+-transporting NADH:ubiquinone oxidoreductase subunit B